MKISKINQIGATLLELILVMGLVAFGTLIAFAEKQMEIEHSKARIVGAQLSQYNNAVRSYIARNPNASSSQRSGSAWLKRVDCGGLYAAGAEFLPCDFPAATVANPIGFGTLSLSTSIEATGVAPDRRIKATTTTGQFSVAKGNTLQIRSDLAGIAALTAASSTLTGYQANSGGLTPYGAATDASFKSNPIDARITMQASNNASNDVWLRTDGGNKMHATLAFDATDPLNRMIVGASRIQNLASQILYLGAATGMTPVSAAKVVADADTEIMGQLRLRRALVADSTIDAQGSISTKSNLSVAGNANIQGSVVANGAISAEGSISSKQAVSGTIFYDENDRRFYVDPSATSVMNNVQTNSIYNHGTLESGGRIKANEYISIAGVATEGMSCDSTGMIGRDTSGKTLSCQNGRWASNGIKPDCQAINIRGYGTPDVTTYACPAGYTKMGWDTTGQGWRNSATPGLIIGHNDYAVVFCCKF